MAISEDLKTQIIKTAVEEVSYDPQTGRLLINQKDLNAEKSAMLRDAVEKEGHQRSDFSTILRDVLDSASTSTPKIQTEYNVQPDKLPLGQHLVLLGNSPDYGPARLELMNIDTNRFIVLSSERRTLQQEDILESVTMPWNSGGKVNFKVLRNGIPFPDELHYYQTYRLECIELHNPPVIYEYLDRPAVKQPEKESQETVEVPLSETQQSLEKEEKHKSGSESLPLPEIPLTVNNLYTADKLTSSNPIGFKYDKLTQHENYKGGIFEIRLISENEAQLYVNDRQMVQDKAFSSLNILKKVCEPFEIPRELNRIITIKAGKLILSEGVWIIITKMKIRLE